MLVLINYGKRARNFLIFKKFKNRIKNRKFNIFVFFNLIRVALPFFFLLMDLPKAVLLAQYALTSRSREDISENIAQGMVILGPTLTLDTSLKLLSIGIGTISKVGKMEELIYFAFLSVIVNYIIFMIFLPACLALALEVSFFLEILFSVFSFLSRGEMKI